MDYNENIFDEDELYFLSEKGYIFVRYIDQGDIEYEHDPVLVGLFQSSYGDIAIKRKKYCRDCMEYEYNIGRELNNIVSELDPKYHIVANTYDLLRYNNYSYIIIEFIAGITVRDLLSLYNQRNHIPEEILQRYANMVDIIRNFECITGFTHYDLHLGNIITNDDLNTFYIIDYGYSHLDSISGWAMASKYSISIGAIPSVYDPMFDIVRLIVISFDMLGKAVPEPLFYMIQSNNFSPYTWEGMPSQYTEAQTYPGSEIIPELNALEELPDEYGRESGWWISLSNVNCIDPVHSLYENLDKDEMNSRIIVGDSLTCIKRMAIGRRTGRDIDTILSQYRTIYPHLNSI